MISLSRSVILHLFAALSPLDAERRQIILSRTIDMAALWQVKLAHEDGMFFSDGAFLVAPGPADTRSDLAPSVRPSAVTPRFPSCVSSQSPPVHLQQSTVPLLDSISALPARRILPY